MYKYTAFQGFSILASGSLEEIIIAVRKAMRANKEAQILIFSDSTGKQMDFDFSGTEKEVLDRVQIYVAKQATPQTGAGRPKLGVVPREISLLPTHWEWLTNQAGGASATIRKLIDEKIKTNSADKNKAKNAQEVTYKFMSALAGDLPNFEEATRFLYRKDKKKFAQLISDWDKDLIKHTMYLAKDVFEESGNEKV